MVDITKQAWAQPVDLNSAMPRLALLALLLFLLGFPLEFLHKHSAVLRLALLTLFLFLLGFLFVVSPCTLSYED